MIRFLTPALAALTVAAAGPAAAQSVFYFGADLSYVNEMEDCGAVYRVNGEVMDPYRLFAEAGTNLVRVRIWNDAEWTDYSDLDDVRETIRRAKAEGMEVLLDFHYSDDWADGDKQIVPKAWRPIRDDVPALSQALYDYTRETLAALDADGLMPDLVQVGNETNPELMGELDWKETRPGINWPRNAALLNAGIRAVRDASAASSVQPLVMLHIAQPENVEPWFAAAAEHGVTDFDLIGVSYYRKWSTQGLEGLGATINRLRHRYAVEVIVVETSYPFTNEGEDASPNLLGPDTLLPEYPATEEGQHRYMVDITQTVKSNGGVGVVYWEPAWVSTRCSTRWGVGSNWENATFFDWRRGNELTAAAQYTRHAYVEPQPVTIGVRRAAGETAPLWLWGDFLGSNEMVVRLTPDADDPDLWTFETDLAPGQAIRYQVFDQRPFDQGLLPGADGFVHAVVGETGSALIHADDGARRR
ncbi:MAG: arabinogalactan endo-1,4-beta-galactosidase [Alphaproteobacteria bacterium]|nr:arabinogalactan endo-1,4-beta-galactosidase [Alphaproteobacteria bacterium]MBU2271656.1 arabinogalactan endo-1,4-beta-galactosidase [Alphaproteobacteria bacterium]MBU2417812.1 arabinogalactan endo-1,4-beta-galactosidase [Alphaproteobacteria bacterium]